MKTFYLAGFAVAASLLAVPAFAVQQDKSSQPAKERKVCRSERATGSFIPKRTCHTRTEWKALDQANAENARNTLDNSRRSSMTGMPH